MTGMSNSESRKREVERLDAEVEKLANLIWGTAPATSRISDDGARRSARAVLAAGYGDVAQAREFVLAAPLRDYLYSPRMDTFRAEACAHTVAQPYADNRLVAILDDLRRMVPPALNAVTEQERGSERATCPGMGRTHVGTQYFDLCPRCSPAFITPVPLHENDYHDGDGFVYCQECSEAGQGYITVKNCRYRPVPLDEKGGAE